MASAVVDKALRQSRQHALDAYGATIEVLEDRSFMAGVLEAKAALGKGVKGKTLEEIREEHGLTH